MTIIELLEKNSENYGSEEALVEINPEKEEIYMERIRTY